MGPNGVSQTRAWVPRGSSSELAVRSRFPSRAGRGRFPHLHGNARPTSRRRWGLRPRLERLQRCSSYRAACVLGPVYTEGSGRDRFGWRAAAARSFAGCTGDDARWGVAVNPRTARSAAWGADSPRFRQCRRRPMVVGLAASFVATDWLAPAASSEKSGQFSTQKSNDTNGQHTTHLTRAYACGTRGRAPQGRAGRDAGRIWATGSVSPRRRWRATCAAPRAGPPGSGPRPCSLLGGPAACAPGAAAQRPAPRPAPQ